MANIGSIMMKMGDYKKARMYYSEAIANMNFIIYGNEDDMEYTNSNPQTL